MRTIPREVRNIHDMKMRFHLSKEQRAFLIGTLLGDGTLQQHGKHFRFHVKHSGNQLSYVHYKHTMFLDITHMSVREFTQKVKGKTYTFAEFVTLTHPEFFDMYKLFYQNGKKSISKEVCDVLCEAQSLAVWFMDDGSSEYAGVAFHTQCFSQEEVALLQSVLLKTFQVESTIRANKRGWILYVKKRSLGHFVHIVQPYILPEFAYKLVPYTYK